jgi:hypothetical protein
MLGYFIRSLETAHIDHSPTPSPYVFFGTVFGLRRAFFLQITHLLLVKEYILVIEY